MLRRVVVTGLGLVSPAGCIVQEAWDKVVSGLPCISKLDDSIAYDNIPCKVAAKVPVGKEKSHLDIGKHFSESKLRTMSLATAYAIIAAEQALFDANWKPSTEMSREETGVCVGMSMVSINDICESQNCLNKSYNNVSPYFIPKVLPNMAASQISIEYSLQGPIHCTSTACATGVHSIGDGFNFIKYGKANVMICGSTESLINPLSIAGFCRLRALSTSFNNEPEKSSRPFDKKRDGFVIGEGAAVLILEEMNHALERNVRIYGEIRGYGLSGDGFHLTAPHESGKGAILAMKRALNDAELPLSYISYVNAHATSTLIGDAIELNVIKALFGDNTKNLTVSSTKGVHGHLLGAAGSLETLFAIYACYCGVLPPTANLEECCIEGESLNCISYKQNWNVIERVALKNAFGFGGTNACLCISNFLPNQ